MKITGPATPGTVTDMKRYHLWITGSVDIRTQLLDDGTTIILVNGTPVDDQAAGAALRSWTPRAPAVMKDSIDSAWQFHKSADPKTS